MGTLKLPAPEYFFFRLTGLSDCTLLEHTIWGLSIVSLFFAVIGIIRDLFVRVDAFSVLVSLFTMVLCGMIFYLVNFTKKRMDARIAKESEQDINILKKVC